MKYFNTCHNFFDSGTFPTADDGYLSAMESTSVYAQKDLSDFYTSGKIYVSFEFYRKNTSGYWPVAFFANSNRQWGFYLYTKTIAVDSSGGTDLYTYATTNSTWFKIYLVYDYANGKADVYLDGKLVYSASGLGTTTTSPYVNFRAYNTDRLRNIIISDTEFPVNETVKDLDITVVSNEWEESEGTYSTTEVDKTIELTTSTQLDSAYRVDEVTIALDTDLGDDITKVSVGINDSFEDLSLGGKNVLNAVKVSDLSSLKIKLTSA